MECQLRAQIEIYLGASRTNVRTSLQSALHDAGFKSIDSFDSLRELGQAVIRQAPDLLVIDTEFSDGEAYETITALRHGDLGGNPFIPVILTTSSTDSALAKKAGDSGADDLLVTPISPRQLSTQIDLLINHRRAFVVTSHFVGPDRRSRGRGTEASRVPMIEVPNTLCEKAHGMSPKQNELHERIERAKILINERQLERQTQEAVVLTELITHDYDQQQVTNQTHKRLSHLIDLIKAIEASIEGTKFVGYRRLCDTLLRTAFALREYYRTPRPDAVRVLKPYAAAILRGLCPDSELVVADLAATHSARSQKLNSRGSIK